MKKIQPRTIRTLERLRPSILTSLAITVLSVAPAIGQTDIDDVFELNAYEVNTSRDFGYYAGNSVSATKTSVAIEDIPISIQVLTRDFLDDLQADSIDDAIFYAAGAAPDTNEPGRYSLRGFTSPEPLRNGISTLAEFYQGSTLIERIEVVKGPVSILYGISEPGGIINYVTKQPLSEKAESFRFTTGSFGKARMEYDVTGPLANGKTVDLDYRLVASYEDSDSWVEHAGLKERIIAPMFKWRFGKNTSLLASVEYYDVQRKIEGSRIRNSDRSGWYPDLPRDFNAAGDSFKNTETLFASTDFQHQLNDHWSFRHVLNYSENDYLQDTRLGFATEGAGPADEDEIRISLLNRDVLREQFTMQTEFVGKYTTDAVELNILIGHEYESYEQRQLARRANNVMIWDLKDPSTWDPRITVAPKDRNIVPSDFLQSNDQTALFGMLQAGFFGNRLRTLTGVRYDTLNGDLIDYRSGGNKTSNPEITNTTPQIGALFKLTEHISPYVLYSESFTPNLQVNPDGSTFDPATGVGKELGFKFDAMENRFSATLSLYEVVKENIVRIDREAQAAEPPVLQYIASGEEKSRGMELDLVYQPNDSYQLMFSYAQIRDAYVVSNTDAPETEGMRLPSTPKSSVSLWNKYTFRGGALDGFFIGGGIVHRDESFLSSLPRDINIKTPSFNRLDLMVGYSGTWQGKPFRVEVKVDNVTDELYHLRQDIIAPGTQVLVSFKVDL
jgi:iron complex outermembrane receptor protein